MSPDEQWDDDDPIIRALRSHPSWSPSTGPLDLAGIARAGLALRARRKQRRAIQSTLGTLVLVAGVVTGFVLSGGPHSGHQEPVQLAPRVIRDVRVGYLPRTPYPLTIGAGTCAGGRRVDVLCWAPGPAVRESPGLPPVNQVSLKLSQRDSGEYPVVASRPAEAGDTKGKTVLANGSVAILEVGPVVVKVDWVYDGQLFSALGQNISSADMRHFAGSLHYEN